MELFSYLYIMGMHYKHGFKVGSPEYKQMINICNKFKLSKEQYFSQKDKYDSDAKKRAHIGTPYIDGSKVKSPEYWKSAELKYKYNITLEDYNKIFIEQGGCCAICRTHQSELNKALCVDHNHINEKVRGLLCTNCNTALGKLKDNSKIVLNAYNYLCNTSNL